MKIKISGSSKSSVDRDGDWIEYQHDLEIDIPSFELWGLTVDFLAEARKSMRDNTDAIELVNALCMSACKMAGKTVGLA